MCGILGFFSPQEKISLNNFSSMLYQLKHRGQDGCGISFLKDDILEKINEKKFNTMNTIIDDKYNNNSFKNIIGHVQYTTSSKESPILQPRISSNKFGNYSFVFNGNIPIHLYEKYKHYTADTLLIEDFLNINSNKHSSWENLLKDFMNTFRRSYSLIVQTNDTFYILRDRCGVRPLYYLVNKMNTYIFTSETCVFDTIFYEKNNLFEVKPGEILTLKEGVLKKNNTELLQLKESHCLFEHIYFLNNKSLFSNMPVKEYRYIIGEKMGLLDKDFYKKYNNDEKPIVIGIPNTGKDYAKSYANACSLEYSEYITKNKNVERTFILKNNKERNKYSRKKYLFDEKMINKNIILVDDSLVRGITMNNLVKNLKIFGVNDIHVRITSPPVKKPCNYGIDIPTKKELIYNTHSSEKELTKYFGCSSLKYFNLEQHKEVVPNFNKKCIECFSSNDKYEW